MMNYQPVSLSSRKLIVESVTESGSVFRPSDWIERLCGSLSTFTDCHMAYSPLLQPAVKEGEKCLILDPQLENIHPELYESIMKFIRENKLKIYEELEPA